MELLTKKGKNTGDSIGEFAFINDGGRSSVIDYCCMSVVSLNLSILGLSWWKGNFFSNVAIKAEKTLSGGVLKIVLRLNYPCLR